MGKVGNWKPGQSGNPNGRPPSNKALTEILKRTLGQRFEFKGQRYNGKRVLAFMVRDLLLTGTTQFPDGKKLEISPKDWIELMQWTYERIDGKPTQPLSGDDNAPITFRVVYTDK